MLASMPGCLLAGAALAQSSGIRLIRLNSFEIRVADPAASLDFYQDLFGMPVQARDAERLCLGIGDGPQFMAMRAVQGNETPAITRIGYAVEDFDAARTQAALVASGFERVAALPVTEAGGEHRLQTWIRNRGGTDELFFADASGLFVQWSSPGYCGGSGPRGDVCAAAEAAPPGRLRLEEINHFTVFGCAAARRPSQHRKTATPTTSTPTSSRASPSRRCAWACPTAFTTPSTTAS
jgi:catechol 2,3-dioxygenase-like lactoylglutathione lyase family enzyme